VIRVPCVCGKTYRVPPEKAGRKLQCRRCGATQRIPKPEPEDDELHVDFEMLESDEGPLPPRRGSREPALQLTPVAEEAAPDEGSRGRRKTKRKRRSKRRQGEARGAKRKPSQRAQPGADESAASPALQEGPERSALRVLARLAASSWWALTPAGIVWGPVIAVQAQGLDKRLGNSASARAQLKQVLLTAWTGALLWSLVVVFGALRSVSQPLPPTNGGAGQGTPTEPEEIDGAEDAPDPEDLDKGPAGPVARLQPVRGEAHPLRRLLVLGWGARATDVAALEAELGAPVAKVLGDALRDAKPAIRRHALRLALTAELPLGHAQLARLSRDPDYGVRRAAGTYQRVVGEEEWAWTLLSVATADAGLDTALARATVLEASEDREQALMLLRAAGELRREQGRTPQEPLLSWPTSSLPNAAIHLGDANAKPEAYAVLHEGAGRSVEALVAVATKPGAGARAQRDALAILAELTEERVCPLRRFLDTVGALEDSSLQATATQALVERVEVPSEELVDWALGVLRTRPGTPLAARVQPLLRPVGFSEGTDVEWLVRDLIREGDHRALLEELRRRDRAGDPELDDSLRKVWSRLRGAELKVQVLNLAHERLFADSLEVMLEGLTDREPQVRLAAARLLLQPRAPEPDSWRRKVAQALATRLRNEDDEETLKRLYQLASGGRFGWLKDKRKSSDYELSSSLREALRQNARKGSEEAVKVLGTHPTERVLKILIEILDRTRDDVLRLKVIAELNRLSGWRKATVDPGHWKETLQPLPDAVKEVLEQIAATDKREREAIEESNAARLAEAKQRFAELKQAGR